jgi:hypothetical protein
VTEKRNIVIVPFSKEGLKIDHKRSAPKFCFRFTGCKPRGTSNMQNWPPIDSDIVLGYWFENSTMDEALSSLKWDYNPVRKKVRSSGIVSISETEKQVSHSIQINNNFIVNKVGLYSIESVIWDIIFLETPGDFNVSGTDDFEAEGWYSSGIWKRRGNFADCCVTIAEAMFTD